MTAAEKRPANVIVINPETRRRLVKRCLMDPSARKEAACVEMGKLIQEEGIHPAAHRSFWNDRFIEAVAFDFPKPLQRRAAHFAMTNGLMGRFEQKTHMGHMTTDAFLALGIDFVDGFISLETTAPGYYRLSRKVISQLKEKFNLSDRLPTLNLAFYTQ